ncbi:MAG: hypothetical protein JNG85_07620 [Spirochaetaceae bacterium]|nr:hypothetical protein [Spirochaetaceae bacterium]
MCSQKRLFSALLFAAASAAGLAAQGAPPPATAETPPPPAAGSAEAPASLRPGSALVIEPLANAVAKGPASVAPELGVVIVLNLDPLAKKETPPLVTNILGSGLAFPFAGDSLFAFEPSVDVYWGYYEYSNRPTEIDYDPSRPRRAVPTELGERDAFMLGLLLEAPVTATFRLGPKFRMSGGLGLGFNLRVGFKAAAEAPNEDVAAINAYFWSKGRFLMPTTLLRGEYLLTERFEFGFAARAFWPLFNLWAGEGYPLLDQAILGGALVIRYRLR